MQFQKRLRNAEAEAGSHGVVERVFIEREGLKEAGDHFIVDRTTWVANFDLVALARTRSARYAYGSRATGVRNGEFDGIVEKAAENIHQDFFVAHDLRGSNGELNCDFAILDKLANWFRELRLRENASRGQRFAVEHRLCRFGRDVLERIVDHLL